MPLQCPSSPLNTTPIRLQPVPGYAVAYLCTSMPLQVNAMHSQPCRYLSKLRLALPLLRVALHCRHGTVPRSAVTTRCHTSPLRNYDHSPRNHAIARPDRALHLGAIAKQFHSMHSRCFTSAYISLPCLYCAIGNTAMSCRCRSLHYRYSSPLVSSLPCLNCAIDNAALPLLRASPPLITPRCRYIAH